MFRAVVLGLALSLSGAPALAFDIDFSWAGLKLCTNGKPNTVGNPEFTLSGVPQGTKYLRFKLVDLNVPSYNHGGALLTYGGQSKIPAGVFKYKSPCPPSGSHNYEWRVTAQTKKNGGAIATAKKVRSYP